MRGTRHKATVELLSFQKERLVGAVGIELKETLGTRKLLTALNEQNDKNTEFAKARYTTGTREFHLSSWQSVAPI